LIDYRAAGVLPENAIGLVEDPAELDRTLTAVVYPIGSRPIEIG